MTWIDALYFLSMGGLMMWDAHVLYDALRFRFGWVA